jgi:hypothetical protein
MTPLVLSVHVGVLATGLALSLKGLHLGGGVARVLLAGLRRRVGVSVWLAGHALAGWCQVVCWRLARVLYALVACGVWVVIRLTCNTFSCFAVNLSCWITSISNTILLGWVSIKIILARLTFSSYIVNLSSSIAGLLDTFFITRRKIVLASHTFSVFSEILSLWQASVFDAILLKRIRIEVLWAIRALSITNS